MSALPQTTREYILTKVETYKNLKIQEVPIAKPKSNQVLVKVHAVSLQFRDLAISLGTYPVGKDGLLPCSDMAGEVIAVGEDVKNWKKGDRVCSNFSTDHLDGDTTPEIIQTSLGGQSPGVLTQYKNLPDYVRRFHLCCYIKSCSFDIRRSSASLITSHMSKLRPSPLTAYNALHGPNPVKSGDTVLVQGTGGVSMFGLQLAVAAGAIVIATSSSNDKLKVAAKHGAKHLINYKEKPEWDKEVLKITNGRGVDHTIEVGGQGTLGKSISAARIGGSIHIIGFVAGNGGSPLEDIIVPTLSKALLIRGIYIGSVAQFRNMMRAIEANPDKTVPIVDKVFKFEDAIDAYAYLESQKHVGKVVIRVAA